MSPAVAWVLTLIDPGGLTWSAPHGCPTQEDVAALLANEDVPEDRRAAAEINAVVTATNAGKWLVEIEIRQPSGELRRELELDSCTAAAEAVALVYALALTEDGESAPVVPDVVEDVPEDEEPKPIEPKAIEPEPTPPTVAQSVPPPARPLPRLAVHAGAGGGVGTIGPGGGHVLAGLGVVWRWVRLGVRFDHAIVRPFRVEEDLGANVSATTGGVELGIPIPVGPIELMPSVDVRAGGVRARAIGGEGGQTKWRAWAIVGAGLSLAWMPGTWWGFRLGAEVEVPLLRHTFAFDERDVARTERVGGLFWLGPEFRFPRRPVGSGARSARAR